MLALAIAIAAATADAQVVVDSRPVLVRGAAPAVEVSITNDSRTAMAPVTGDVLTATATTTDPDGDAITSVTYRWLRGDVVVGNEATYTTTTADTDQELRVEVIASTDDATTDPSDGMGSAEVTIANAAPVASNLRIDGVRFVGETLTAKYAYDDAEGDLEGSTLINWCRRGHSCGIGTGPTYRVTEADRDQEIQFEVTPVARTGTPTGNKVGVPNGTALIPSGLIPLGATSTSSFSDLPATFSHTVPNDTGYASAKSQITYLVGMEEAGAQMVERNVKVEVIAPNGTVVWTTTCKGVNGLQRLNQGPLWRYSECMDKTVEVNLSGYPRAGTWRLSVTALAGPALRMYASLTINTN